MSEIKLFSLPEEIRANYSLPQGTKAIETERAAGILSHDAGLDYDCGSTVKNVTIFNSEGFGNTVEGKTPRLEEILDELTQIREQQK